MDLGEADDPKPLLRSPSCATSTQWERSRQELSVHGLSVTCRICLTYQCSERSVDLPFIETCELPGPPEWKDSCAVLASRFGGCLSCVLSAMRDVGSARTSARIGENPHGPPNNLMPFVQQALWFASEASTTNSDECCCTAVASNSCAYSLW